MEYACGFELIKFDNNDILNLDLKFLMVKLFKEYVQLNRGLVLVLSTAPKSTRRTAAVLNEFNDTSQIHSTVSRGISRKAHAAIP